MGETDQEYTYCDECWVESLYCIPETNKMLYVILEF